MKRTARMYIMDALKSEESYHQLIQCVRTQDIEKHNRQTGLFFNFKIMVGFKRMEMQSC